MHKWPAVPATVSQRQPKGGVIAHVQVSVGPQAQGPMEFTLQAQTKQRARHSLRWHQSHLVQASEQMHFSCPEEGDLLKQKGLLRL